MVSICGIGVKDNHQNILNNISVIINIMNFEGFVNNGDATGRIFFIGVINIHIILI